MERGWVLPSIARIHACAYDSLLTLSSVYNYIATPNNMKMVHWQLMGGPLYLV